MTHLGRGVPPLLQPSVEPFPDLIAQVPDVVGGDDRLNVRRKPASARGKVNGFVSEVQFDAAVQELAQHRPIAKIARAAIRTPTRPTVLVCIPNSISHPMLA